MAFSLPALSIFSEEVGNVELLLQAQLDAPNLRVSECYDVNLQQINNQFKHFVKRMSPQNVVDAFVPVKRLQQPLNDLITRGVRVHQKYGFRFTVGFVPLDMSDGVHEVVHMQIALGNVLNFQDSESPLLETKFSAETLTSSALKPGYDSICLSEKGEYCVFVADQVRAIHYVKFEGGDNLRHDIPSIHKCSICGNDNATIFCENDNARMCAQCDHDSHSGNRLLESHVRVPLSDALTQIQLCPLHKGVKVQYFCTKCHCPVCLECKLSGNHSKGEMAKHPLVPMRKAYDDVVAISHRPNAVFINRRNLLTERTRSADERLREVEENETSVEEEIKRIAAKAIAEAKLMAGEKALCIKSVKTELQRKISELKAIEKVYYAQRDFSEPLPFLETFYRSSAIEREIDLGKDVPESPSTRGDLCVSGSINVSSPESAPSAAPKRTVKAAEVEGSTTTESYSETYASESDTTANEEEQAAESSTVEAIRSPSDPHITALSAIARRKLLRLQSQGIQLSFIPFENSDVISDAKSARDLYLCFPFRSVPQTHLMFSSKRDGRSIAKLHNMVDDRGITAILVKANGRAFGGFAASKWNSDGKGFGRGSSSFLFSVKFDAFIPYRPQGEDPCPLFATKETISFGRYDLKLGGNFDDCSSTLECSYGVGFPYDSEKATHFLAGSPTFSADIVEVWGFYSPNAQ